METFVWISNNDGERILIPPRRISEVWPSEKGKWSVYLDDEIDGERVWYISRGEAVLLRDGAPYLDEQHDG